MNQQIFNTGLGMETISLYLLCCGLIDAGLSASLDRIKERWNSSEDVLEKGLQELLGKRILQKEDHAAGTEVFVVTQPHEWR
jgi:hypothetical protein